MPCVWSCVKMYFAAFLRLHAVAQASALANAYMHAPDDVCECVCVYWCVFVHPGAPTAGGLGGPSASTSLELLLNSLDGIGNCNSLPFSTDKNDTLGVTGTTIVTDTLEELTGTGAGANRRDSGAGFAFQLRELDDSSPAGVGVGGVAYHVGGCGWGNGGVVDERMLAQRLGVAAVGGGGNAQDTYNRLGLMGRVPASVLLTQVGVSTGLHCFAAVQVWLVSGSKIWLSYGRMQQIAITRIKAPAMTVFCMMTLLSPPHACMCLTLLLYCLTHAGSIRGWPELQPQRRRQRMQ